MLKHFGTASKIGFGEVRALAGEEHWGAALLDTLDRFLGVAILLTPAVLGPSGVFALNLLQPKDELVEFGRAMIKRFASSAGGDFVAQRRRMTAAHCLMTYTAFFDALDLELPTFANAVALTDKERTIIVERAYERTAGQVAVEVEDAKTAIAVPHPAMSPSAERLARVALYKQMAEAYVRFVQGLAIWDSIHDDERLKIRKALKIIPERAAQVFEAQYLTLLTDYPAFHRWAELYEFTKSRQLTADLAADLQDKISLVAEATQGIDVGLRNLERLAAAGEPAVIVSAFVKRVTEGLHNEYISRIEEPVINDRYTEHGAATLIYPRKCDIFVPQEFSTIQYLDQHVRLELESTWANADIHGDLGAFTMRYLDSAYSTEAPLLVLGHPGSGKSLFTEMIAARLGPPAYHPIRLELRDIDADADLQDQIERQIRSDTGYEVNWAAFADELQNNPPVIILDGYDELLQASGKVFSNYLTRVQSFQRREAVQGRPVRIIVTSRLTLIDKAIVPEGSTIVRLLVFSHAQRNKWTATWNATNRTYFVTTGVKPFSLDPQSRVADLAAQPLLLLMLAVYDSLSNQLGNANLDRTSLYHSLLVRFIERERTKGESADAFAALTPAQRNDQIESDLERLGIAAIGMFNRQALHINRDDLNRDIEYFGMAQQRNVTYGPTLTQAELLLGSFFFIHESKSQTGPDRDGLRPSAFEFLHNTFGEFLTADFILRKVLGETRIIRKLSDDPQLLAMREYHLNNPPPDWFACLIYTSLHTRPVVCSMMREWLTHKLTLEGWEASDLEEDLKLIASRQLANVLCGNAPPAIMQQVNESPFESLPILGHLAVYSLNIVLLWLALTRADLVFKEADLEMPSAGCRPWDRLTNLWRSWFSIDALAGVPAVLHAYRQEEAVVLSLPLRETAKSVTKLEAIHNVADALADNVTYGLTAPHVFDLRGEDMHGLYIADERLIAEDIHLSILIKARTNDDSAPWIRNLGCLMARMGYLHEAEAHYRRALEIFERLGDQAGFAASHRELASVMSQAERFDEAEVHYRYALDILERLGDPTGTAGICRDLGTLMLRTRNYNAAESNYKRALDISRQLGDRVGIASSFNGLGASAYLAQNPRETEEFYGHALQMFQKLNDQAGVAEAYKGLGAAAALAGDLDKAESRYRSALEIYEWLGDQKAIAEVYIALGSNTAHRGETIEAVRLHVEALAALRRVGVSPSKSDVINLAALRELVGERAFMDAARTALDDTTLTQLIAAMDDTAVEA